MSLFTLGHSTLTEREFVQAARGIDVILDVRSHPSSSRYPHFDFDSMREWLPRYGIRYEWWPGLGGWAIAHARNNELRRQMAERGVDLIAYAGAFPKQRIAAERPIYGEMGPVWTNQGLYDYSWYMSGHWFLEPAQTLINRYSSREGPRAALVCAESVWYRCHRGMIADYLAWRDVPCYHLPTKIPKHETTPRFRLHRDVMKDRLDRYDPEIKEKWLWVSQAKAVPSA